MRWIFCRDKVEKSERRSHDAPRRATDVTSVEGMHVLLIDNGDTRDFLANTLRHYRANVAAARSVHEALATLGERAPQVIVCNCDMNDVETEQLVQAVRRLEARTQRRIPTIAVAPGTHGQRPHLGVHISLPRPLTAASLVAAISKLAPA